MNNYILKLLKFADDSSILPMLRSDSYFKFYKNCINDFTKWYEDHNLLLNVLNKTCFKFQNKKDVIVPQKHSILTFYMCTSNLDKINSFLTKLWPFMYF